MVRYTMGKSHPVRLIVSWKDSYSNGTVASDRLYAVPEPDWDDGFWEAIDDVVVPWRYDRFEIHRVEISPNVEFELEMEDGQGRTVAEEFLDDLEDSLKDWISE